MSTANSTRPLGKTAALRAAQSAYVCTEAIRTGGEPMTTVDCAARTAREDKVISRALRILENRTRYNGPVLDSPFAVHNWLRLRIGQLPHEVFCVLLLDVQNRLVETVELFRGTLTETSVYPREVVKLALAHNAAGIILAHNHPSGNSEPSTADEALTQNLKRALDLVDVRVLDHLVVTAGSPPVSFAERGLL